MPLLISRGQGGQPVPSDERSTVLSDAIANYKRTGEIAGLNGPAYSSRGDCSGLQEIMDAIRVAWPGFSGEPLGPGIDAPDAMLMHRPAFADPL